MADNNKYSRTDEITRLPDPWADMIPGYEQGVSEEGKTPVKYQAAKTTDYLNVSSFELFPDEFLIINDISFTSVPTAAISLESPTDVFVGETIRSQAPVISSEGRQDLLLKLSLPFKPGEEQTVKLRRLMAELTKHPLVFIYNNKVRKSLGIDGIETTMFILESGSLRSTSDTPGTIVLDLLLHYFNYKPFSNHFYYNTKLNGVSIDRNRFQVAEPINITELTSFESSDYSLRYETEKVLKDIREGALSTDIAFKDNVPVNFPSESDAWMYYASKLEKMVSPITDEPSDYIGFSFKYFESHSPPEGAKLSGLDLKYVKELAHQELLKREPAAVYKTELDKTSSERYVDALLKPIPGISGGPIKFRRLATGESKTLQLVKDDGTVDVDSLYELSNLACSRKHIQDLVPFKSSLALLLQRVADHFSGRTIEIIVGFRKAKYGKHLTGEAIDFRIKGVSNRTVFEFIRKFKHAGTGYYPNSKFVHLDSRNISGVYWIDLSGPGEKTNNVARIDRANWLKQHPPDADELNAIKEEVAEIKKGILGEEGSRMDQIRELARTKNEKAKQTEETKERKEDKRSGNLKEILPKKPSLSSATRNDWIEEMYGEGWEYYYDDVDIKNIFFHKITEHISSSSETQRVGEALKNITCTALSINFGHRIAPLRLCGQSSYSYQFLGAGNKSGQMVLTFTGIEGRNSADRLKKMFYLARDNAKMFSSVLKEAGTIKLEPQSFHSVEQNAILALFSYPQDGIKTIPTDGINIIISNVQESSSPDGTDKHQLVIEFLVQEFAKETFEKRFVTSFDPKKKIIKRLMKLLKAKPLKHITVAVQGDAISGPGADYQTHDNWSIKPVQSIAVGRLPDEVDRGWKPAGNTPAWLAEIVVKAADLCNEIDAKIPPTKWLRTDSPVRWEEEYKKYGAETILHGRIANIDPYERKIKQSTPKFFNDPRQKIKEDHIKALEAGQYTSESVLIDPKTKKLIGPIGTGTATNKIHQTYFKEWVDRMALLAEEVRSYAADEENFEFYFGSIGKDMVNALAAGLGECYDDLLLPAYPGTIVAMPPDFYVYDDSDEDPALAGINKESLTQLLEQHAAKEQQSIEAVIKNTLLGGSYLSKNMDKIIEQRRGENEQRAGEVPHLNYGEFFRAGSQAWEPVFHRMDDPAYEEKNVKKWVSTVTTKFGKTDDEARLKFMDQLIELNLYLKKGRPWDQTGANMVDQDLVETLYQDVDNKPVWQKIAFGPNVDYAAADMLMMGTPLDPSHKAGREAIKMNEAAKRAKLKNAAVEIGSLQRTVLPDGSVTIGPTQEEQEQAENENSLFGQLWDWGGAFIKDHPLLSGFALGGGLLFGSSVGSAIETSATISNIVKGSGVAIAEGSILSQLNKLDHPKMKGKITEENENKKIAQLASATALEEKANNLNIKRAFPTFKIYFIEEDEQADTEKLDGKVVRAFDDFYSYSAIQEIRITRSRKIAADLAVVRMTNVGGVLLRKKFGASDPALGEEEERQGIFANTKRENPFERMILQDGVKVQIRLGYENNPDHLDTAFLGQIVEISPSEDGKILEIMCQGYGAELEAVELGPLEDGPTFYSSQQILSGSIIQDFIANFGRQSKFNRFNPAEKRHAYTGGHGKGLFQTISPTSLVSAWAQENLNKLFHRYSFLNYPQDDNIFAPPPSAYSSTWARFWDNACIYRPLKQTPWQIFKEHELRHPGYIASAVPYGHSPRMTMFFGAKIQHYWSRPPSPLEVYMSERTSDMVVRMRGMGHSQFKENGAATKAIEKLAKQGATKLAAAVLKSTISMGNEPGFEIGKMFGRYRPFRNYHKFDSEHNILKNEIRTSIAGTYNEVEVLYFDDEGDVEEDDAEDLERNIAALQRGEEGILAVKLDENIPEEHIRSYREEFPSCITVDMAKRYVQGIYARTLRDAYKGELIVVGKGNIKPYDVAYIKDNTINMMGPIEVEAVTHIINNSVGWVSVITPDLCVEINDMFNATVFDVTGAAYSYLDWTSVTGPDFVGQTAVNAVKGIGFLAMAGWVKFLTWSQDGAPVATTPLTLGGKPFMSITLGQRKASLFFCLFGKWEQYWDDLDNAWRKFDIAEAVLDTRLNMSQKLYGILGATETGGVDHA